VTRLYKLKDSHTSIVIQYLYKLKEAKMMGDRYGNDQQQQQQQETVQSPLHLRDEVTGNERSSLLGASFASRVVNTTTTQNSTIRSNDDSGSYTATNQQEDQQQIPSKSPKLRTSKSFTTSPRTIRKSPSSIRVKGMVLSNDNLGRTKSPHSSPKIPFPPTETMNMTAATGITIPAATTTTTKTTMSTTTTYNTTTATNPSSSRAPSRSPSTMSEGSDELPNNVSNEEQLDLLPSECLSGNLIRPLQHYTEDGDVTTYSLRPMTYSVIFILLVELLERFAFYGINYTQTSYLTGTYNPSWNAGMESVLASSYVSISVAVAYTTPFVGAFFADQICGDYYTILLGTIVFYLPGLFLIAFTTVPKLLGDKFNTLALQIGLLFLWPVGTGIVKSVVNVFGAKQFHPLLQSTLIEAYYVNFYMCINVGALIGGIAVPVIAQHDVTIAYFLPVTMLCLGLFLFLAGSSRYVCSKPKVSIRCRKRKNKNINSSRDKLAISNSTGSNNSNNPSLLSIAKVSFLIVPFNIAYSQMGTTFVVQGTVMTNAFGWIDAATMNNADAVAVLAFGYFIGNGLYPWLAARGIKIPTTYKFAIGSAFGAVSIASALMIDIMIHEQYLVNQHKISILWQTIPYVLIGVGEIFAVSAAYEVAFTASPPEKKVLSSAMNLFCIGGIPNVFCIGLYQLCRPWFTSSRGDTRISHIHDYSTARVDKYFWVLLMISLLGVFINLLPSVREYVESIEDRAVDMIRTPKTPKRPPVRQPIPKEYDDDDDSVDNTEEQLLKAKRHQYYLKYGSGPSLYKMGSMRAGPALKSKSSSNVNSSSKRIKKTMLSRLYNGETTILVPPPKVMLSASGKPVLFGRDMALASRARSFDEEDVH
jgi:dipeptide/tripeptide permease